MTSTKLSYIGLSLALALGGCGTPSEPEDNSASPQNVAEPAAPAVLESAPSHAAWVGKWIGVEGMYVDITQTSPGAYNLEMQSDLDTKGSYGGEDAEGGIAFERGGERLLLRAATGDETGLKYLAGKQECLMVKSGEGYCKAD